MAFCFVIGGIWLIIKFLDAQRANPLPFTPHPLKKGELQLAAGQIILSINLLQTVYTNDFLHRGDWIS